MTEESNEWQVKFRRETRLLRNRPELKNELDNFFAELRTSRLSRLRELPEEVRREVVITHFDEFANILKNADIPENEQVAYQIAVRKIIYGAFQIPHAGSNRASAPTHNQAAQNYLFATLDLRTALTFNNRLTVVEAGYLKNLFNFSKRLTQAQNTHFETKEAREQNVTELVKAFAKIVNEIPKEKLGDIDIQALKKQVRKIIHEAFSPQQSINIPDSPRIRR